MNTLTAIKNLIFAFKGKEMSHNQNLALFNIIEVTMGEGASNAFARHCVSSDELNNEQTTYTFDSSVLNVWNDIKGN